MTRALALLAAAAAALALPAGALAHATLRAASPATQARVEAAPTEIRLRFDQGVTVTSRAIQVLAPDGTLLAGTARTHEDGRVVVAPVSRLERGSAYTVRWRVTSADGHSPSGVFTFGIGVAAPPPTEAVGAEGTTRKDDLARWALFAALALLLGPLAVRLLVLRGPVPAPLERRFHLLANAAALLVIDVGIAVFVLRAANALQLPFGDLLYGDLQPFAEKTRFGVAFLVMTVGFGVVSTLLLLAWILDRLELRWPAFALALALASGLPLSGHQATEPNATWLSQLADWVHLVAASIWVGGLVALAFCVWPLAPELRRRAFLGFSRLAVALVGALVLGGLYLAVVRLPELADLWQTEYGRLLLLKGALVGLALSWGAAHHFLVRPRLAAGREPRVRPSLVGETVVACAVLLAAAMLANGSPPPAEEPQVSAARASG
ncbi:MAG TPA: copper resistance protein CopC [Gaiellaceae bacterium]|nr:copper resistance protein CopC [Gaiellaceae bacterium]